ncbi:MAG: cation:dicarboxylase symporter family transporter [Deltaproteobacteria bacterium]|nr:cation:dicarboxylase symporter family transporter [Deltaproteobacteria bacterium]
MIWKWKKISLHKRLTMQSPWVILGAIIAGGLFGYFFKGPAQHLTAPGRIFIGLMQMCILPIMITAIISSVGRLVKEPGSIRIIRTLFILIFTGLFLASAVGLGAGLAGRPGAALSQQAKAGMGKMLFMSEQSAVKETAKSNTPLADFFVKIVPTNIFAALSEGNSLRILLFTLLLGVAIGLVPHAASETIIDFMIALFEAFKTIIGWVMKALPVGLFCVFAGSVATTGLGIFQSLGKLLAVIYGSAVVLFIIYQLLISISSRQSIWQSFVALRETYLVALGTANSFVALPSALNSVQKNLKLDEKMSNLIIPLGIVINRQGVVLCFAVTAVFLAQLYDVTLGVEKMVIILVGAALAGMAALGRLGVAASLLAFVLEPLGLPVETAFIVLFSLEIFLDPLTAVLIIQSNCGTVAVLERINRQGP